MAGHTCQTFCRTSPTNCDDSIHCSSPSKDCCSQARSDPGEANGHYSIHGSWPFGYMVVRPSPINCDDSIHGSSPSKGCCRGSSPYDSIHGSSPSNCDDWIHGSSPKSYQAAMARYMAVRHPIAMIRYMKFGIQGCRRQAIDRQSKQS